MRLCFRIEGLRTDMVATSLPESHGRLSKNLGEEVIDLSVQHTPNSSRPRTALESSFVPGGGPFWSTSRDATSTRASTRRMSLLFRQQGPVLHELLDRVPSGRPPQGAPSRSAGSSPLHLNRRSEFACILSYLHGKGAGDGGKNVGGGGEEAPSHWDCDARSRVGAGGGQGRRLTEISTPAP